jgi:hypothetical protein
VALLGREVVQYKESWFSQEVRCLIRRRGGSMGREVAQSGVKVAQYEKRCSIRRKCGSSGGWMAQLVGDMAL